METNVDSENSIQDPNCTTSETTGIQVSNLTGGFHQIVVKVIGKCEKIGGVWKVTKYIIEFTETMNGGQQSLPIRSQHKPASSYNSGSGDQMMILTIFLS